MSENRELHAIAIADCKAMCNIEALRFGGDLEHFYLNNIWAFSKIKSLEPLKAHTGLKTVDLACKTERGAGSIDFNEAWPELEALTISPNLRRNFITASEVRR